MHKTIPWFGLPLDLREFRESLRIVSLNENPAKFERLFSQKMQMSYAYSTFSGRTALYLILKALNLNKEDEVIVPIFVCPAVVNAILMVQAKPVFVDIDPISYTIDIDDFNDAISTKTKAVIPVHTFGHPCDMDSLCEIAKDKGIYVIEDCAQAPGAEYNKRLVGSFGDVSFFSFNIDKHIVTGSGGMVLTEDKDIANSISSKLHLLEKCTWSDRFYAKKSYMEVLLAKNPLLYKIGIQTYSTTKRLLTLGGVGGSTVEEYTGISLKRMSPEAAGLGMIQLNKLDKIIEKRMENAKELTRHIKNIEFIEVPRIKDNVKHVFLYYTIKIKGDSARQNRDKIIKKLNESGINAMNLAWPLAIHQMPHFKNSLKLQDERFPVTEDFVERFINLPMHSLLEKSDIKYIIDTLCSIQL